MIVSKEAEDAAHKADHMHTHTIACTHDVCTMAMNMYIIFHSCFQLLEIGDACLLPSSNGGKTEKGTHTYTHTHIHTPRCTHTHTLPNKCTYDVCTRATTM
jgi:hypothetical protein